MEPIAPVDLSHLERGVQPRRRGGLDTLKRSFRWASVFDDWCEVVAPCPWGSSVGLSPWGAETITIDRNVKTSGAKTAKPPLYTPEERRRRDASPWTLVQGVLAPLQFLAFGVSLILIFRYFATGQGYELATASILVKTLALYVIMITGSIWEKVVFGKWLFARAFFWEDVFSMLVLGLQTAYVAALLTGWGTPRQQMLIAVAAYAAYAVNASQFLLKLRAARLQGASQTAAKGASGDLAGFAA